MLQTNTTRNVIAFLKRAQKPAETGRPQPLPTELLECIVDFSSNDMSTLCSLSLVCKRLSSRSQMHIFTTLLLCVRFSEAETETKRIQ